ncbi:MAG TPA: TPM domain-containing protein, partial [Allosphingosinicella sp.]|nr:TPM domain-containing protein [Allosphingosinicella sp.]
SRQLVVATVPDLQGHEIADYANRLFRTWRLGQGEANNGVLLLVAVAERKVRIEVGYGLEGVLTDALSSQIIRNQITPRFRENDYPGGIEAGAEAIIAQLQAPPEAAEARAVAAANAEAGQEDDVSVVPFIFWIIVLAFIIISAIVRGGVRGRRYRRGRGWAGPVTIWGSGYGGGGGWGGGGGGGWSGGGGFSGGGGSSGGGGASGGW